MDYKKLVERLKCPKVRECPYDYANSCKVCQKELRRDTITAITELLAHAEAAEKKIKQLTPCDRCAYDPPSSGDGKPCSFCPASKKED